ncbi:MAG: hypothetical protein HN368_12645 [Spirochaetales bacterium]|nr:hypothetical protein [Spirochaetales bacterium]
MNKLGKAVILLIVVVLSSCPGSASFGSPELRVWFGETEIIMGAAHDFGETTVSASKTAVFTIRNNGVRALELPSGVTLSGAAEFKIETQPTTAVAPGEESTFSVSVCA